MSEELPPIPVSSKIINDALKTRLLEEHHKTVPSELATHFDFLEGVAKFCELLEGMQNQSNWDFLTRRMDFLTEEVMELSQNIYDKDTEKAVDNAVDVAVVAIGQLYHVIRSCGFSYIETLPRMREACFRVTEANLRKNIPHASGDKITKPDGWKAPEFKDIITRREKGEGI